MDGRWQQDFLLQLSLFAPDEKAREENQILLDALCRWAAQTGAEERPADFVSISMENGKLLYPASDGLTFVYQLEGTFVYREKDGGSFTADSEFWWVRRIGEEEWQEIIGMDETEKTVSLPEHRLLDHAGRMQQMVGAGKGQVFFRSYQNGVTLNQSLTKLCPTEAEWLCCGKKNPQGDAVRFGKGFVRTGDVQGEKRSLELMLFISEEYHGRAWQDKKGRMSIWKE